MTRIYQAIPLKENCTIELDNNASHHVANVLRAEPNDIVTIFNGLGGEYTGTITTITKKSVHVSISDFNPRETESPLDLCLIQGISRGEKMDFTIQKAVELGVKKIIPVFTERCNVKLDHERLEKRVEHWRAIVISASEQSGRNKLAEVLMPCSLEKLFPTLNTSWKFVLSPYATKKLNQCEIDKEQSVALLIGPEGGLSEKEIILAETNGFIGLNVGPRIMRTETAGIAMIAILQNKFGDA